MKNISVIIKKQVKDTFKNKTILIQFVMFPVMSLIMENAVKMEDMPESFFVKLFAVMYIGMAPLVSTASIISEEKETNTLRVLTMANVKPWEYLAGVGVYVWTICMLGAAVMSSLIPDGERLFFCGVMAAGFVISTVLGACIGIVSGTQMKATSLTMPCMMILSFSPMLSMFNDTIRKISTPVFTWQIKRMLDDPGVGNITGRSVLVILVTLILFVCLFIPAYRIKELDK